MNVRIIGKFVKIQEENGKEHYKGSIEPAEFRKAKTVVKVMLVPSESANELSRFMQAEANEGFDLLMYGIFPDEEKKRRSKQP